MRDPKIRKKLLKSIISLICKCANTLLAHVLHLGKHYYWFYKKFTTKRVDMQITKQTTNKTIIDHSSTKTSLDSTWYGRRLRQKTSRKSRRLPDDLDDFQEVSDNWNGSRLEDFLEDFLEVIWKTSWKSSSALYFRQLTCKSSQKSFRSEKPTYQIQI